MMSPHDSTEPPLLQDTSRSWCQNAAWSQPDVITVSWQGSYFYIGYFLKEHKPQNTMYNLWRARTEKVKGRAGWEGQLLVLLQYYYYNNAHTLCKCYAQEKIHKNLQTCSIPFWFRPCPEAEWILAIPTPTNLVLNQGGLSGTVFTALIKLQKLMAINIWATLIVTGPCY